MTSAPRAAANRTVARPIPLVPPTTTTRRPSIVTTATRPARPCRSPARLSSAAAASATFSHGPRHPICGSSSPDATSPTRYARSAPNPGPTAKASMRVPPPRSRACSKSIDVGSIEAIPMLCTQPPGSSSAYTSASMRPPTLSSAPCTGMEIPSRPTTTSEAPSAASPSPRSGRPTDATTWAPALAASWTANLPTPPDAPVTSTRCPTTEPSRRSARSAVTPATGTAAAIPRSTLSGTTASSATSTALRSAHAPDHPNVTTRLPAGGPRRSLAGAITTPDASNPGTGTWRSPKKATSAKLIDVAATSIMTCDGPSSGSDTTPRLRPFVFSGS